VAREEAEVADETVELTEVLAGTVVVRVGVITIVEVGVTTVVVETTEEAGVVDPEVMTTG